MAILEYKKGSDPLEWLHERDSLEIELADLFAFLGRNLDKFSEYDQRYLETTKYFVEKKLKAMEKI